MDARVRHGRRSARADLGTLTASSGTSHDSRPDRLGVAPVGECGDGCPRQAVLQQPSSPQRKRKAGTTLRLPKIIDLAKLHGGAATVGGKRSARTSDDDGFAARAHAMLRKHNIATAPVLLNRSVGTRTGAGGG